VSAVFSKPTLNNPAPIPGCHVLDTVLWLSSGIPHGTARALHVQLCSERAVWLLNLVPGIASGTKRDCTGTV
jgi:hypothetical protein